MGHAATQSGWIATVLFLGGIAAAIVYLAKIAKAALSLMKTFVLEIKHIHKAILVFMGEHELMSEDYCTRQRITRHNFRSMAEALSRNAEDPAPNGHAKSKAAQA